MPIFLFIEPLEFLDAWQLCKIFLGALLIAYDNLSIIYRSEEGKQLKFSPVDKKVSVTYIK